MPIEAPKGLVKRKESWSIRLKRYRAFAKTFLKSQNFIQFIGCLLILGLFLSFSTDYFQRMENVVHDFYFRQRILPCRSDIALIEISEDSIQSIGRWPWPRHYHAVLTHILHEWGAKAVVFDMVFSEPSTEFDDTALAEAIGEAGNVYLPVILESEGAKKKWIKSLPEFTEHSRGVGHINVTPDKDGTIRRIQTRLTYEKESYPHLSVKVAGDYSEKNPDLPTDKKGDFLIPWAGKWEKTFKHFSYVDILKSYQALQSGQPAVVKPEDIKGQICLIGLTATGHADIKANPIESAYPGLGIHANVINSQLNQYTLRATSGEAAVLLMIGVLGMLGLIPFRNLISLLAVAGLTLAWFYVTFLFFVKKGLLVATIQPVLLLFSLFVFSAIYSLLIINKEKFHFFELATRDGLTGLFVIRHFRALLAEVIEDAQQKGEPLSLIMIDLDNFKKVNDTYGHQAGDMVLKGVALDVQSCVRSKRSAKESDYIGRYGGEEIIILLRKSDLTAAAFIVAERVRKTVEKNTFSWEGSVFPVTISLGVSTLRPGETDGEALIKRADQALYRAKKEGKNRVCIEDNKEKKA